jgi:hypothetical protein
MHVYTHTHTHIVKSTHTGIRTPEMVVHIIRTGMHSYVHNYQHTYMHIYTSIQRKKFHTYITHVSTHTSMEYHTHTHTHTYTQVCTPTESEMTTNEHPSRRAGEHILIQVFGIVVADELIQKAIDHHAFLVCILALGDEHERVL